MPAPASSGSHRRARRHGARRHLRLAGGARRPSARERHRCSARGERRVRGRRGECARRECRRSRSAAPTCVIAVAASGTTPLRLPRGGSAERRRAHHRDRQQSRTRRSSRPSTSRSLLETGAEVIVGSTRMNAGTAQKAALGLISSLTMIRLGHIYDGLMVNLRCRQRQAPQRASSTSRRSPAPARRKRKPRSIAPAAAVKPAALVLNGARSGRGRANLDSGGRESTYRIRPPGPGGSL